MLFDSSGNWLFEGLDFHIQGGPEASVLLLGENASGQVVELNLFADETAPECFDSSVPAAAAQEEITGSPILSSLASPEFWNHLRNNIKDFAAGIERERNIPVNKGLLMYTGTAPLLGRYSGILVTAGDVILAGNFSIDGILLHLGGGKT